MNDLLHIRLNPAVRKDMRAAIANGLYSSESEFVRDAIRKNLEFANKAIAVRALMHSVKNKPNNVDKKTASELFREFGLAP